LRDFAWGSMAEVFADALGEAPIHSRPRLLVA
jgi:hypothetical protein